MINKEGVVYGFPLKWKCRQCMPQHLSQSLKNADVLPFIWLLYWQTLSWCLNFILQLEMEDEDTIDVFQQQTGGSPL